jgi:hypothetical protein
MESDKDDSNKITLHDIIYYFDFSSFNKHSISFTLHMHKPTVDTWYLLMYRTFLCYLDDRLQYIQFPDPLAIYLHYDSSFYT